MSGTFYGAFTQIAADLSTATRVLDQSNRRRACVPAACESAGFGMRRDTDDIGLRVDGSGYHDLSRRTVRAKRIHGALAVATTTS